jgi:hypothetical protein
MISDSTFLRLLERKEESGLSVKSFCSNEGIAPSTFYYWRKRVSRAAEKKLFIPLVVNQTSETKVHQVSSPGFVQEQRVDNIFFEIVYTNGTTLRIKNEMDLAGLRSLILLMD